MFELKLFQSGCIPLGSEYDLHPLDDTFKTYLYRGWLRGPVGSRLLFTLADGFWNDRDSDFWQNADGPQPAVQLPDWVKFALTLAENSRRNIWTLLPQDMATDTEFTFRIPLASPCFGFAFDEAARTICLKEEDDALRMMQEALVGLLRAAHPAKGGRSQ